MSRDHNEAAAFMLTRYATRDKALMAATDHAMASRDNGNKRAERYWLAVYRAILHHRLQLSAADIAARQADYPKARD